MTATINLDDVLAILEERPHSSTELAELFDRAFVDMRRELRAAERVGTLKRVGMRQLWARPDYVSPIGRKPSVDRAPIRSAVLAALALAPASMHALAEQLPFHKRLVDEVCKALQLTGEIRRHGSSATTRWFRPGVTPAEQVVDVPDKILKVLESGPTRAQAITAAIGMKAKTTVVQYLRALEADGKVKLVGRGGNVSWALASWTPAPPKAAVKQSGQFDEMINSSIPELEPDDTIDVGGETDQDFDETIPAKRETKRAIRETNARGHQLRHAQERPPAQTVVAALPWWATAPREGFTAAAGVELERMRASKEALKVGLRILQ